jgi:hypothetical protein
MSHARSSGILLTHFISSWPLRHRRPRTRGLCLRRRPGRSRPDHLAGPALGPTGYGDSPTSPSHLRRKRALISPDVLLDEGWLKKEDLQGLPAFPKEKVDFGWILFGRSRPVQGRRALLRRPPRGPTGPSTRTSAPRTPSGWMTTPSS